MPDGPAVTNVPWFTVWRPKERSVRADSVHCSADPSASPATQDPRFQIRGQKNQIRTTILHDAPHSHSAFHTGQCISPLTGHA